MVNGPTPVPFKEQFVCTGKTNVCQEKLSGDASPALEMNLQALRPGRPAVGLDTRK